MDPDRATALFQRVGYDPRLELLAFERISDREFEGARAALIELVGRLRIELADGDARLLTQLLADVLLRINRRVNDRPGEDAACQANRLAILHGFSDGVSAREARERFLDRLDALLAAGSTRRGHPHVLRAIDFIESHYQERMSLSAVAQRLAVSPSYLSRLFTRETGMTLTCYLQRVRLRHATALLAEGERSCSEIAYLVGYQNYRDFYRNLVKYERASPRQLRRRLRQPRSEAVRPRPVVGGSDLFS